MIGEARERGDWSSAASIQDCWIGGSELLGCRVVMTLLVHLPPHTGEGDERAPGRCQQSIQRLHDGRSIGEMVTGLQFRFRIAGLVVNIVL